MTPENLLSGTDRCAWVARSIDADIIANIQGDEPFLDMIVLDNAIALLERDSEIGIVTAAKPQLTEAELNNPNIVKVLVDKNSDAIYFSRQNIPYIRAAAALQIHPALQHIGLYVYRRAKLLNYVTMPQTTLEKIEQLEQLRILENGEKIRVLLTDKLSLGIDTQEDVKKAERILSHHEI